MPAQKLFLTDLPAEIRNIIYEYVLPAGQLFIVGGTASSVDHLPGILFVSQKIRAETSPVFYSTNEVMIHTYLDLRAVMRMSSRLSSIHLSLSTYAFMTAFKISISINCADSCCFLALLEAVLEDNIFHLGLFQVQRTDCRSFSDGKMARTNKVSGVEVECRKMYEALCKVFKEVQEGVDVKGWEDGAESWIKPPKVVEWCSSD